MPRRNRTAARRSPGCKRTNTPHTGSRRQRKLRRLFSCAALFQGNCADALSYYRDAIGAEILFQIPFSPNVDPRFLKPGMEDKILRAGLRISESVIYLSDGHCDGTSSLLGFSLTLKLASFDEAERLQRVLAEDRPVRIPLRKTT